MARLKIRMHNWTTASLSISGGGGVPGFAAEDGGYFDARESKNYPRSRL